MKLLLPVTASVLVLAAAGPAGATDFIRGDANGDGRVTISDAYRITQYLFLGRPAPDCLAAANADGSDAIELSDAVTIFVHALVPDYTIMDPYPIPGPDPNPLPFLDCQSYGGGAPVADPAAAISLSDAVASVGADGKFAFRILVSNSLKVAALSGKVRAPSLVFAELTEPGLPFLDSPSRGGFKGLVSYNQLSENAFDFVLLVDLMGPAVIPPGDGTAAIEVRGCLAKGTKAGEYPLILEEGELTDAETALPIVPALGTGTLRVLADVTADGCAEPPPTTDPTLPNPSDVTAIYRLQGGDAVPGGTIDVPFVIRANQAIAGYQYSLKYDEAVLSATGIDYIWQRPDGRDYYYAVVQIPAGGMVDPGTIIGAAIFSYEKPNVLMPPDIDLGAAVIHFQVRPDTAGMSTEVRFEDGGHVGPEGPALRNSLTIGTASYYPELGSTFVFVNGRINVGPDIATFFRGDSDGDGEVSITDAIYTLTFLFLGGEAPACLDAADFDDNGAIEITDPIATLQYLFLSAAPPAEPYGRPGMDLTPDELGCRG